MVVPIIHTYIRVGIRLYYITDKTIYLLMNHVLVVYRC